MKYSLNAFLTLFGVSSKPSRPGSSPIYFKILTKASSASLSEISLSNADLFNSLTYFLGGGGGWGGGREEVRGGVRE